MKKALIVRTVVAAFASCSSVATAQVVWIGPEIPVNSVTAGPQFAPSIAATPDGGFVAAWQSAGADGEGFGIRARVFHADGTPATAEIPVNSTTAGDQVTPAVAVGSGRFVVAWASSVGDGDGFGIFARQIRLDGTPHTAEFLVNATTAGNQVAPRVERWSSVLPGGDQVFVFVWTGPNPVGSTNEIYARSFFSPASSGAEFRVNSTVLGEQLSPALLRLPDDSLVAAWASEGQDGSGYGVYARRFWIDGTFFTSEIPVAQITTLDQLSPALATVAGGFVVAWQRSLQPVILPVGPQPVISFRRFTPDGTPISSEEQVQFDTSLRHERPALASDVDGGFTVGWRQSSPDPDDDDEDVFAARFDSAGAPETGHFRINTTVAGDQIDAVLASGLLPGRFVAVWSSFGQDGSSFGVFAQRFGEPVEPCATNATTLCLDGARFRVRAAFATAAGASGDAQAVALTDESGYFTFFDPANVEIVVKMVDACGLADFENFWVFATGLTNVEVTMTVEDTVSGDFRVYRNPLHQDFQPILDTAHFQVCDAARGDDAAHAAVRRGTSSRAGAGGAPATMSPAAASGGCVENATTLCLRDGRFEVTIDYETALPSSGAGQAVALTDESGYFWFFDDANVELVIKVIDGCDYNDRYWVFAGGLTDVGTHLVVRDTLHPGSTFEREKPIGVPFPPILSIEAFDTCP